LTYSFQSSPDAFVDSAAFRSVPNVVRLDSLFRRIETLARRMTTMDCHATANEIRLRPTSPEGLPVSVYKGDGRQTLCIGSWYADVDHEATVFSLVEKAIRGELRLRMEGDGKEFHTFTVEVRNRNSEWREVGQMGGCWFRKKPIRVVKYLFNEVAAQQ
jgi:hypothetical protein